MFIQVKIIYKGAYNAIWEHGTHNFFYFHECYVNPNYVLMHDNVTLQACTATHAVFAVTAPDVNVYDVAKHPFVMLAQYVECKRLVLVPLRAMYRLSEETGDPTDREIIGYGMTARSGSTLITKMFSRLPETVAMSEPFALFHAHKWYSRGLIPEDDYPKLILALLRLQFKKLHHVSYLNLCLCCEINSFSISDTLQKDDNQADPVHLASAGDHEGGVPVHEAVLQCQAPEGLHEVVLPHPPVPSHGEHADAPVPRLLAGQPGL